MKMKLKYIIYTLAFLVLIASGLVLATGCGQGSDNSAANADRTAAATLYTCGMHPDVIQDGPGQCPICGMNLTPMDSGAGSSVPEGERRILYWVAPMDPTYVRDEPGQSPMGMDLVPVYEDEVMSGTGVTIDPAIIQSIGVRYANVVTGPVEKTIRAAAHVDYDEDNYVSLSTRTDGWIERLYVSSPGAEVREGDPLFDFYAPTLYSAQEEYLIARRMGDTRLANAAVERLRLLGVSDEMIEDIRVNGSRRALTITSPMDGIVVSMGSSGGGGMSGNSGSSGMSGMSGMGSMNNTSSGMSSGTGGDIREGDHVGSGTSVFSIANLSTVWVYAHVYEDELQFVSEGMPATLELDYLHGQTIEGFVDFIYPFLDRETRDIKIRLVFDNADGQLMPGMFGTVHIESRIEENGLLIPSEAVIYSGDSRVVFLALPAGRFAPQEVTLGVSANDGMVQVTGGLVSGQSIVTSAQFLLDSESRFREAINKMFADETEAPVHDVLAADADETETPVHDHPSADADDGDWVDLAPDDPNANFRCPMPGDRYYTSEDGECPVCGMFLEEHDPEAWAEEHDH